MFSSCVPGFTAKSVGQSQTGETKISVLRVVLLAVLVFAAANTTWYSYYRLKQNETDMFVSRFDSTAENALNTVVDSFERMRLGIQEISSSYSHNFPDAAQWPNVAWTGFRPTATLLNGISSLNGIAMVPLVRPNQAVSYEAFTADYYQNVDPYCAPEDYLFPLFTPGAIWGRNTTSFGFNDYTDRFGNTTSSPHKVMTPVSQYLFCSLGGPNSVGYNLHGDPVYTKTIDTVIDCAAEPYSHGAPTVCSAISPAVSLPHPTAEVPHPVIDDMVAIHLQPVFPMHNKTMLTGFAVGGISWKALLSKVVPVEISALQCVIAADTGTFTFRIENGIPHFEGHGDLHHHHFTGYRRSMQLLNTTASIAESSSYVLSIYPTHEFEDEFRTALPVIGAVVMLAIFLFCSALFVSYDVLTQRRFDHNEAVLDTKRRFVRFISHEIRTPLNTVRLGMKLLELEMTKFAIGIASSSPANLISKVKAVLTIWKQLADEIVESSESAVEVLNDLLNYDKIEIGTLKLEFGVFPLRALVEKTVAAMQVQAQQKEITIVLEHKMVASSPRPTTSSEDVEGGGAARAVIGDLTRMRQVLRNLVSNALKFTPEGGSVSVSVVLSDQVESVPEKIRASTPLLQCMPHAGSVRIAVTDSGAGLSPQQLSEICAEGVQFNANELQAGQGSGLGLFISKGIIEQHGGKLVVTSEGLGKGATFTIVLPIFSMTSRAGSISQGVSSGDLTVHNLEKAIRSITTHTLTTENSAHIHELSPQRLLVVDDSGLNRKMLVRLLTSKDHVCEQAEDGEAAVRKYLDMVARGEPPDAILMDYEMPVMNGPSATARLRELGCACLIVGVTGNVLPQDVAYFIAQGAEAVLPKPVVLEDFEHLIMCKRDAVQVGLTFDDGMALHSRGDVKRAHRTPLKLTGVRRVYVEESCNDTVQA